MFRRNYALDILSENAKTFLERDKIRVLTENEVTAVNNAMIGNLYQSAIEKAHINFEDIPESKGDITKYSGYKSMTDSLAILTQLSQQQGVKIAEIDTVTQAINNIIACRDLFERGFALEKEFVVLEYNVLVYACVEATSSIISSHVDFVKRPDAVEFQLLKGRERSGDLCIQNLDKFNMSVKSGDFNKVLRTVVQSGQQQFVGLETVAIAAAIIGAVLVSVTLIRELVFFFYFSRMRLSDYLEQQAALLEINKNSLSSQGVGVSAKEKNQIVKKQESVIAKLHSISERIKVNRAMAEKNTQASLKKENQTWTIDDVKSQAASTDPNSGFQLL